MRGLILFSLILVCFSSISQTSDVYIQHSKALAMRTYPEGGFDSKGNLIVCADDENRKRILVFKYDTSRTLIDTTSFPCLNGGCYMNDAVVSGNNTFMFIQERISWENRIMRMLVLDEQLSVIKDSILVDSSYYNSYSQCAISTGINNVLLNITLVDSIPDSSGTQLFLFSEKGRLLKSRFYNLHFGEQIANYKTNQYLLALNRYTDSNRRIHQNKAAILNTNLEIQQYFRTDSSAKHFLDRRKKIQVNYYPTSIYSFPNIFSTTQNTFTIVSTFEIDTFDMTNPTTNFMDNYVMRVAQTTTSDSIINEHYFISDSSWISAAYRNSVLLPDSSFLVLGVRNVSKYYEPISPIRSSYILAKFDKHANLIWTKNFSQKNYYYHATQIVYSSKGGIAILGTAFDYSKTGLNHVNILFLNENGEIKTEVGIKSINNDLEESSKVYPNPANRFVYFNVKEKCLLELTSTSGQLMSSTNFNEGLNNLDISILENGIYLYRILSTNQEVIKKGKLVKH